MNSQYYRHIIVASLIACSPLLATNATAAAINTWDFTKLKSNTTAYSPTNPSTVDPSGNPIAISDAAAFTFGGLTVNATAFSYAPFPLGTNPFTANNFSPTNLSYSSLGIGACELTEGGGQCKQVSTNGVDEAIRLQFSGQWRAVTITLSSVDANDTFRAYGLTSTTATAATVLDPSGIISEIGSGSGTVYTISFTTTEAFQELYLTTNVEGSFGDVAGGTTQDFTVESFSGVQVSEPAPLLNFSAGLLGIAFLRRRRDAWAWLRASGNDGGGRADKRRSRNLLCCLGVGLQRNSSAIELATKVSAAGRKRSARSASAAFGLRFDRRYAARQSPPVQAADRSGHASCQQLRSRAES